MIAPLHNENESSKAEAPNSEKPRRLVSLDVLRGFDMFWIIGGTGLLLTLAHYIGWEPLTELLEKHTEHAGWEGFNAIDLVFPLFVFISGVTMPFSLTAKLDRGVRRPVLYWGVFRRMVLLVLLGLSADLFALDFENLRPLSVLGLIGVAYFIAATIVISRSPRGQFAWLVGILLGYSAVLKFIPVPGIGAGVLTPGGCLGGYIDSHLLSGKLYQGVFDPEGLLNMLSASATALLGALAGYRLRKFEKAPYQNVLVLLAAGAISIGLGLLLSLWIPIVKAMWSSSYVLVAGGMSLLLLALFYLVIDVWRLRWLGWIFIPIGMNAITIYVGHGYIDFHHTANLLFGGIAQVSGDELAPFVSSIGLLTVEWLFLYFLYSKKIFLRV